jgi:hypothetical protein
VSPTCRRHVADISSQVEMGDGVVHTYDVLHGVDVDL